MVAFKPGVNEGSSTLADQARDAGIEASDRNQGTGLESDANRKFERNPVTDTDRLSSQSKSAAVADRDGKVADPDDRRYQSRVRAELAVREVRRLMSRLMRRIPRGRRSGIVREGYDADGQMVDSRGAAIGDDSLVMVGEHGKVVAFEPNAQGLVTDSNGREVDPVDTQLFLDGDKVISIPNGARDILGQVIEPSDEVYVVVDPDTGEEGLIARKRTYWERQQQEFEQAAIGEKFRSVLDAGFSEILTALRGFRTPVTDSAVEGSFGALFEPEVARHGELHLRGVQLGEMGRLASTRLEVLAQTASLPDEQAASLRAGIGAVNPRLADGTLEYPPLPDGVVATHNTRHDYLVAQELTQDVVSSAAEASRSLAMNRSHLEASRTGSSVLGERE